LKRRRENVFSLGLRIFGTIITGSDRRFDCKEEKNW